jgi:hypothetical protein
VASHNKKAISICAALNKNGIKISESPFAMRGSRTRFLFGNSYHHLESLWRTAYSLFEASSFGTRSEIMSRLTDVGFESADQLPLSPGTADSAEPGEIDRSLSAVMREIARSLAGWLFFVVAVQLLLYATHLI